MIEIDPAAASRLGHEAASSDDGEAFSRLSGAGGSEEAGRPTLGITIPERSESPGVSMFRVESDAPGHARLDASPGGTNATIKPGSMLYVSAEDRTHAEYYAEKKAETTIKGTSNPLPNVRLHEFKVDSGFYNDHLSGMAAPQRNSAEQTALFGKPELHVLKGTDQAETHGIVQRVDENKGPTNYGIPSAQIPLLQSHIKPGSLTTTSVLPPRGRRATD